MVMVSFPVGRAWLASPVALGLLVSWIASAAAQDEAQAKQQLEFMQAAVANLEVEASDLKSKAALTVVPKPLLRYNDPTRGGVLVSANVLLDAGVWRLGAEGRPTALVTIEIYQNRDGSRVVAYEFLSLTEMKFSLKHKTEKIRWDPAGSALTLQVLPEAPRPAATAGERLVQMRQLAKRFAATERHDNETIECRLLTQPIDRYQSAPDKIVDGALFAYANGTNPELGVLFETDGERWLYGTFRLTSAEATVTLDGRQVASFERFNARGRTDWPYHSGAHKIATDK
jgi:hypothetical protein